MQFSSLLDAAHRYAELGYSVFPCAPGTKRPLTENGFHDATTNAEQIERWWSARRNANVAIATQGLLVVDVHAADNAWPADDPDKQAESAVRAIQCSSHGGENVLGLFGGSGSTLIGCEQTDRRAFLMELDALYADTIVTRSENFTGKTAERIEKETRTEVMA